MVENLVINFVITNIDTIKQRNNKSFQTKLIYQSREVGKTVIAKILSLMTII